MQSLGTALRHPLKAPHMSAQDPAREPASNSAWVRTLYLRIRITPLFRNDTALIALPVRMQPAQQKVTSKKSCLRCRSRKRKCDRAFPKCSLCMRYIPQPFPRLCIGCVAYRIRLTWCRLQQDCKYTGSTPPEPTRALSKHGPGLATCLAPSDIKADIENNLSGSSPADIAAKYLSNIHPWFPIVSDLGLSNKFSTSWKDGTVEHTLLYFTMLLLISEPESIHDSDILPLNLQLAYLLSKRWTASLEAAGLNSLDLIRSRLFLTLFEAGHGLYPATYISFGAVLGAAEAFNDYSGYKCSITRSSDEATAEEHCVVNSALAIIDRLVMTPYSPSLYSWVMNRAGLRRL